MYTKLRVKKEKERVTYTYMGQEKQHQATKKN